IENVIGGVLLVVLSEKENAALPLDCSMVADSQRGILRRSEPDFLRELDIFLQVAPREQGRWCVIQVCQVIGLPPHAAGDERKVHALAEIGRQQRRCDEVAMSVALEVTRDMMWISTDGRKVAQRVISVVVVLPRQQQTDLPAFGGVPEQLAFAKETLA